MNNGNFLSDFIKSLNPASDINDKISNSEDISNVSSNILGQTIKYCNIVINFKDKEGNPLSVDMTPNLFLYEIEKELPWKNAIYESRLDITTPSGDSLLNDANIASYSGSSFTIKMSTTSPQYFRFTFLPTEQPPIFNPDIHGGLNVHFNTTPADSGIEIIYDAIVDYYAEMRDDIFTIELVSQNKIVEKDKETE